MCIEYIMYRHGAVFIEQESWQHKDDNRQNTEEI